MAQKILKYTDVHEFAIVREDDFRKEEFLYVFNFNCIRLSGRLNVNYIVYYANNNGSKWVKKIINKNRPPSSPSSPSPPTSKDEINTIMNLMADQLNFKYKIFDHNIGNYLLSLYQIDKYTELNQFLKHNTFKYMFIDQKAEKSPLAVEFQVKHLNLTISFYLNNTESKDSYKKNLNANEELHLIVLLWQFSIKKSRWQYSKDSVVIIDKIDCFLENAQMEDIFKLILNEFKSLGLKTIITTDCFRCLEIEKCREYFYTIKKDRNELKFTKSNEFESLTKYDLKSRKLRHSYINKFDGIDEKLIRNINQFDHLEKLENWNDIPMFSIITGVNGIGKTTLLKYFQTIMPNNSMFIANLLANLNYQPDYQNYLNILKSKIAELINIKNKPEDKPIKQRIKDILFQEQIPLSIKCSPIFYLPLLLIAHETHEINKHLHEKNFKYKISPFKTFGIYNYISPTVEMLSINEIHFTKNDTSILYQNLSSGEMLQLAIYLWEFDLKSQNFLTPSWKNQQVLLIDEPDSCLHPDKLKTEIVDFLKHTLVEKMGVQVMITTHNPCTICQMDLEENVFVMYEDQEKDRIKIVKATESPISPVELLTSGFCLSPQQLVLVESEMDKLYYEEINRQLVHLANKWNNPDLRFYPSQLRFVVCMSNDNKEPTDYQKELQSVVKTLEDGLDSRIKMYVNSVKESIDKFENKKLIDFVNNQLTNELEKEAKSEVIVKFSNKIKNLEKIPNEFFQNILYGDNSVGSSVNGMIKKLHNYYNKAFNELYPTSGDEKIKLFVNLSNSYWNSDSWLSRNYMFGILNQRQNEPMSQLEENEFNRFLIFTDRFDINNYILDPINIFFILYKENVESKKFKKIMKNIEKESLKNIEKSDLAKWNIEDLDKWNTEIVGLDANKNEMTKLKEKLGDLLDTILSEVQSELSRDFIGNDDDYNDEDPEKLSTEKVKFVQPNVQLEYHKYLLTKQISLKAVGKLFCDCDENKCKEKCISMKFKEYNKIEDKYEICSKTILKYLKDNSYNFIVSECFIKQFRKQVDYIKGGFKSSNTK